MADNNSLGQGPQPFILLMHEFSYVLKPCQQFASKVVFFSGMKNAKVFFFEDRIFYIGVRMSFRRIIYDF